MRKLILAIGIAAITVASVKAEGYQVNTLSARQVALGHTGVSQKLGAESMLFNPAGMAFMNNRADISAGITGTMPTAHCDYKGYDYVTDNDMSTPLYLYAGFKISEPVKVGLAFYTPYGSGINWGTDWAGAIGSQSVKLSTFCFQPTVSWKILDNLSVGAGITVAFGSVDLSKGLVSPESADLLLQAQGQAPVFNGIIPASVNLKGTSKLAVGVNIGAMWDINEKFTVGASFRSKMMAKVGNGDAYLSYPNEQLHPIQNAVAKQMLSNTLGILNEAKFKAEMPMPYTLTFGLSYRPIKKLELSLDGQLTGWSTYKQLDIEFKEAALSSFNQNLTKNYKNSWAVRFGAAYNVNAMFDVLAGVNFDTTPVNIDYYNPETPGMSKIAPSLGVTCRPVGGLSITLSCSYIAGLGKDNASYTYDDLILKMMQMPYEKTFTANYKCKAWAPTLGIGYKF